LGILPREWSPTGPFSTVIPLAICVSIEIITAVIKWNNIRSQDKSENNKIYNYVDKFKNVCQIKNKHLLPGHIIFLVKNDVVPIDGILIDTVSENYAKINLALLTGESNIHHIPKPNKNLSLDDYIGSVLVINYHSVSDTNFDGWINLPNEQIKISQSNLIAAGSIIKSDSIYIWVSACGNDKINKKIKNARTKYSTIDKFVGQYMMNISVCLLIFLIIMISLIKTYHSVNPSIVVFMLYCVQNWILFNGIIPFSIKIFLILARNYEAKMGSDQYLTVNDASQIDDFGKIKKIICDKTGTITKNKLEFTKIIAADSVEVFDITTFTTCHKSVPKHFLKCLGLCIHHSGNEFATNEDKIIRANYHLLGSSIINNNDNTVLFVNSDEYHYKYVEINGLDFTFERKLSSKLVKNNKNDYFIYTKGSIDILYHKIKSNDKNKLEKVEQIIGDKYPDLRLLSFAYKKLNNSEIAALKNSENQETIDLLESNLVFLGIIGIRDILQTNVSAAIAKINDYGISCSLCTGDRKITAITVAKEVNIFSSDQDLIEYNFDTTASAVVDKTLVFGGNDIKVLSDKTKFQQCLVASKNFIGYNMVPSDKSMVTSLIESANVNVLAIGDGFNDLGMFNAASISVAIKGSDFVENSADFSIKEFFTLVKIFQLATECYHKNTGLINFTFYRSASVIFAIVAHCLINYHILYESPFNGFVLQAFNFAWAIAGIYYLVIYKKIPQDNTGYFKICQTSKYSCYKYTSVWNIMGIINGIVLVCICHYYLDSQNNYFNDVLALFVILTINLQLYKINSYDRGAIIYCGIGILNFIIYLLMVQTFIGVFWAIISISNNFYLILFLHMLAQVMIC